MKIINASEVVNICDKTLSFWHRIEKGLKKSTLDEALLLLNFKKEGLEKLVNDSAVINCYLWHLEDQARAKSFSDTVIANIKRAIDTTNQRRNHMKEQVKRKDAGKEHIAKCKGKVDVLLEQRKDLARSFDELITDFKKGSKKLKMYYQLKMYNDPSTNPFMKK